MLSCYGAVHGAHRGAPLCRKHLAETARSLSPASTGPRTPRSQTKDSFDLTSTLRTSHAKVEPRAVRFESAAEAVGVPPRSREPSPPRPCAPKPPPAYLEPLTPLEAVPAGEPVLLRLRPSLGSGSVPHWYLFPGTIMGVSPDSRRNERLLVDAPSLQLQFSIPAASVEEAPHLKGEERKLPRRRWVEEHLHLTPMGGDVYASRLPPHLKEWAEAWDGVAVQARGFPPVSLTREHRACLASDPEAAFIPHEDERVFLLSARHRPSPEFETPPRPQLNDPSIEPEAPDARQRPTAREIFDVYQAWHCQGGTHAEGVALTASALDITEEEVRTALAESSPPLPPPVGPPPGLPASLRKPDPLGSHPGPASSNPFRPAPLAVTQTGPGLIQALGDQKQTNPLLQGAQAILSQPVSQGDPAGFSSSFHVSSLFPSIEPRTGNMSHERAGEAGCLLGKGLRRDPSGALPWSLREGIVSWYQAGGASR